MIFVMIRLFHVELRVMVGYLYEFPVDVLPEFSGNDGATVFGWKDYVIITEVDTVTHPSVFMWLGHASIVP